MVIAVADAGYVGLSIATLLSHNNKVYGVEDVPEMVIKSTIPVGYIKSIREKTCSDNIIFRLEFLRESKSLYDNVYLSRIIVDIDMKDERLLKLLIHL